VIQAIPGALPTGWTGNADGSVTPTSSGTVNYTVTAPTAGVYRGWVGNSFRGHLRILAGQRVILDERHILNWTGNGSPTSDVEFTAGTNVLTVEYTLQAWQPGAAGRPFAFGPLLFATTTSQADFQEIDPAKAEQLCGRPLDWLAVVSHG
jgi:hypothetical protein